MKSISFTGVRLLGIGIRNKAGLKKVSLELGSNAAVIVDKGIDIDKIIQRCVSCIPLFKGRSAFPYSALMFMKRCMMSSSKNSRKQRMA